MVKRLPQHGQRVEKKVSDLLLDLNRAETDLRADGFSDESAQIKAIADIRNYFGTARMQGYIKKLLTFAATTKKDTKK